MDRGDSRHTGFSVLKLRWVDLGHILPTKDTSHAWVTSRGNDLVLCALACVPAAASVRNTSTPSFPHHLYLLIPPHSSNYSSVATSLGQPFQPTPPQAKDFPYYMFSGHPVSTGNVFSLTAKLHDSLEKYVYLFVIISDMASPPDCKLYKNRNRENKPLVDYGARQLKESTLSAKTKVTEVLSGLLYG